MELSHSYLQKHKKNSQKTQIVFTVNVAYAALCCSLFKDKQHFLLGESTHERKISCVAFFKVIVVLTANYHQHTDIPLVLGDVLKRICTAVTDTQALSEKLFTTRFYIQHAEL